MLNIGDTFYIAADLKDGGGWSPQYITVVEVSKAKNAFVGDIPMEGRRGFRMEDQDKIWFSSYGKCHNECCKRNGYKDAFNAWCVRTGVKTEDKEEALKQQMRMFGVTTYEQLCDVIV